MRKLPYSETKNREHETSTNPHWPSVLDFSPFTPIDFSSLYEWLVSSSGLIMMMVTDNSILHLRLSLMLALPKPMQKSTLKNRFKLYGAKKENKTPSQAVLQIKKK